MPYIFILCMEVFSSFLVWASNSSKSGIGIQLCLRSFKIPCLLFADDCLLFCKANQKTCAALKSLLDDFCTLSGQLVNFNKSVLTFSKNISSVQKHVVMGNFNIPQNHSLGCYLGCPVFQGRPTCTTFQELLNKTASRLDRWKTNSLSKAGRTILIQSHLESLLAHTKQCFQLPQATLNELNRTHRHFFWKTTSSDKGFPLVAWDKIC